MMFVTLRLKINYARINEFPVSLSLSLHMDLSTVGAMLRGDEIEAVCIIRATGSVVFLIVAHPRQTLLPAGQQPFQMASWPVGWLGVLPTGWLVCLSAFWLDDLLPRCTAGRPASRLTVWLVGQFPGETSSYRCIGKMSVHLN
jgi:hypothetical protein